MDKILTIDFLKSPEQNFEVSFISHLKKTKEELAKPHQMNCHGIYFYTENHGNHSINSKKYEVKQGDIYLVSKEQIQFFEQLEKSEGYLILFKDEFLENNDLIKKFHKSKNQPIATKNFYQAKDLEVLFKQMLYIYLSNREVKFDILKRYLEILLLEVL